MLKSFILAATSIACILSISSVADAGDRGIDRHSKKQLNLITNLENSAKSANISAKDLKGIKQAIIKQYKEKNKGPQYPSASGATSFFEIKAIKLTSYLLPSAITNGSDEGSAGVSVTETQRTYGFGSKKLLDKNNQVIQRKYEYIYETKDISSNTRDIEIRLVKRDGKWIAN
jgi:hypothetical protein